MHAARFRPLRAALAPALVGAAIVACGGVEPGERSPRERLVSFTVEGKVGTVEDGDTLTLVTVTDTRFVVRLSDLDSPEIFHRRAPDRSCPGRVLAERPGQPMGSEARDSLAALVTGRRIRAECYEIDRFGRPVCHVFAGGVNVNLAQLERGWGMVAERPEWVRDPASRPAEAGARARSAGVWSAKDALHPGVWRDKCWGKGECPGAQS